MTLDPETRRRIHDICEDAAERLGRAAPQAHGVTVDLWCSSNDPGWKFAVNDDDGS